MAEATGSSVPVYAHPDDAVPNSRFSNPNEDGAPRVFLAVDRQGDWLNVLLPIRPNGTTGWIRRNDVRLTVDPYSVTVRLRDHRVTVLRGTATVLQQPIGVGSRSTRTPTGLYYITELLRPPDPAGFYGPYAFGISGYSDVLDSFGGGPGIVGIHGTDDLGSLGHDVSHGCIRMSNNAITTLASLLPLGTPVSIKP
ncbi:MAG: hypothetical protein JWO37_1803 [Acidimicrobiales bacterium]|nr:hypothetical protein [Acidimicrobiales bacterium]